MFKKICLILFTLFLVISFTGCVTKNNQSSSSDNTKDLSFPATTQEQIYKLKQLVNSDVTYDRVMGDINKYKGIIVAWGGKVFVEPEKDDKGVYLQLYYTGEDKNFLVGYKKPDFEVKNGDYLKVYGKIKDKQEGENAFGAKLAVPIIEAGYIEKGDRSIIGKKIKEIEVNQKNSQNQFDFTIEKILLLNTETIIYCKAKNNSSNKIYFYTSDTKLVQEGRQVEAKYIYGGDGIPSEIVSGVEIKGILVFPKLDKTDGTIRLVFGNPSSDNYDLRFKEISFDIELK